MLCGIFMHDDLDNNASVYDESGCDGDHNDDDDVNFFVRLMDTEVEVSIEAEIN